MNPYLELSLEEIKDRYNSGTLNLSIEDYLNLLYDKFDDIINRNNEKNWFNR